MELPSSSMQLASSSPWETKYMLVPISPWAATISRGTQMT